MIGTLTEEKKSHWSFFLLELTHAYNSTEHSTTGLSPFYLFGRNPSLPIDILLNSYVNDSELCEDSWVDVHYNRLKNAFTIAQKYASNVAASAKKEYDNSASDVPLLPGERVLVRTFKPRKKKKKKEKKIGDKWEAVPYIIVDQPILKNTKPSDPTDPSASN
ncbi:hypothetical protein HOLleu_34214 [Holothuria leucospilota]|uniref:Uncharacterized protein n=1 Tax=Holothuria leucospilota TaxID=206669 RepID=A0A9Q1BHN5_HOLLE|nr:hypothetical protein HOLleu_34214 [Holothuria leucospilota]